MEIENTKRGIFWGGALGSAVGLSGLGAPELGAISHLFGAFGMFVGMMTGGMIGLMTDIEESSSKEESISSAK
ncbi:MAG: hypothetical protein Q4C12_06585 [Clostridia bacterium]|nr:hypothetical protein [Clostridia bacterium]